MEKASVSKGVTAVPNDENRKCIEKTNIIEENNFEHLDNVENTAKFLRSAMMEDIKMLCNSGPCSSAEKLVGHDANAWLKERPTEIVKFLSVLLGLDLDDDSAISSINRCIEHLYASQNKLLIMLTSFCENILTHPLSGSKVLANLNGATRPAASYVHSKNWLAEEAKEEISRRCSSLCI